MNGKLFNSLHMNQWDMGIVILALALVIFVLLVISIVLCVELSKLKKRYERFSQGRDANSLEKEIGDLFIENNF